MNHPSRKLRGIKRPRMTFPQIVTPECFNRGSIRNSHGFPLKHAGTCRPGSMIAHRRVFTTGGREKTTFGCIAVWLKIPPTRNSSLHSTSYSHQTSRPERGTPLALRKSAFQKVNTQSCLCSSSLATEEERGLSREQARLLRSKFHPAVRQIRQV
jgi:hypothetical protein